MRTLIAIETVMAYGMICRFQRNATESQAYRDRSRIGVLWSPFPRLTSSKAQVILGRRPKNGRNNHKKEIKVKRRWGKGIYMICWIKSNTIRLAQVS